VAVFYDVLCSLYEYRCGVIVVGFICPNGMKVPTQFNRSNACSLLLFISSEAL
jgi:hypothetical protein